MLESALRESDSVYADIVAAVARTLPAPGPDDLATARRLTMAGPPVEAVGLDPYPAPGPTSVPLTLTPIGGPR
jgi:nitrate reductase delta subunit